MAVINQDFESGTADANITPTSTGMAVAAGASGATLKYSTAQKWRGTKSARAVVPDGGTASLGHAGTADMAGGAARAYFRLDGHPDTTQQIMSLRYSSGNGPQIQLTGGTFSGRIQVTDATGARLDEADGGPDGISPQAVTAPVEGDPQPWFRAEIRAVPGTGPNAATTGLIQAAIYLGDGNLIWGGTWTACNAGTTGIAAARAGKLSTAGAMSLYVDDFAYELGRQTLLGPQLNNPITDAGLDQTVEPWQVVTLGGSATSPIGTGISSHTWTQVTGPVVTLAGTGAARTFEAPAVLEPVTLAFDYTATDANGLISTADRVQVDVLPATDFVLTAGAWAPMRGTRI